MQYFVNQNTEEELEDQVDSLSQFSPEGSGSTTISEKKKLKPVTILLAAGCFVVLLLTILIGISRLRSTQFASVVPPQIETKLTQPTLTTVEFVGSRPTLPSSFGYYVSTSALSKPEAVAASIAATLGLGSNPFNNLWVDQVSGQQLLLSPIQGSAQYLHTQPSSQLSGSAKTVAVAKKVPADDQLITTAADFLSKLPLPLQPDRTHAKLTYYKGTLEPQETTRANASSAKVTFPLLLDNYPLYEEAATQAPFTVDVNANLQVTRATMYIGLPPASKAGQLEPLPVDEAVDALRRGQGVVTSALAMGPGIFQMSDFKKATLTEAQIEYHFSTESMAYFPFYRFKGTATTNSGYEAEVSIIVPAYRAQPTK